MADTILTDLQADIAGRLMADSYFTDIPVIDERKGDIETNIAQALGVLTAQGGKCGVCCVVQSPVATDDNSNAQAGPLDVDISVLVLENVTANSGPTGTGKEALTVARRVHRVLKLYSPGGLANCLVSGKPAIVPVPSDLADVAYEVRFTTTEADVYVDAKVNNPVLSPISGAAPRTVTITCATAGASIYYTTNGTHPRSGNGTLYSGPVAISQAGMLRACAYKSGMIASNVQYGVYT